MLKSRTSCILICLYLTCSFTNLEAHNSSNTLLSNDIDSISRDSSFLFNKQANKQTNFGTNSDTHELGMKDSSLNTWLIIANFLLVIVTIIMACIANKQYNFFRLSSLQQNRLSRYSNQKQLRAYIGIANEDTSEPVGYFVHLKIVNFGQTPAYNVKAWAYAEYHDFSEQFSFTNIPKHDQPSSILNPKDFQQLNVSFDATLEHQRRVIEGVGAVYVYGRIGYEDIFGIKRFTKFRFKTGTGTRYATVELAEGGNEAG